MTLGAALLPAAVTVPPAALLVAWVLWYWRRLGRSNVPESRRRIRRASVAVMLAALPFVVQAASFLDAQTQPGAWAVTWILVMFALCLVVLMAGLDMLNTLRLARRKRLERIIEEAADRARRRKGAST